MMPPWSDTEGLEASVRVSSISSKIEVAGVCCSLSMVAAVDTVKNGDQSLHTWPASLFSCFCFCFFFSLYPSPQPIGWCVQYAIRSSLPLIGSSTCQSSLEMPSWMLLEVCLTKFLSIFQSGQTANGDGPA